MTTWRDAHLRAATLAAEVHADLDIPLDRRVDVFKAVEDLGLVLAFAPLGSVSGMYLVGDGSSGVLLHEGHPLTRQRYTASHELGHYMFGHTSEIDTDLEGQLLRGDSARWPSHEKEAEAFGAWFLMPRRLIRRCMADLNIDTPTTASDVYRLALWLGTSYAATAHHLATTRIITGGDAGRLVRIAPRSLKKELLGDFSPSHLRRDVWWIGGERDQNSVEVRPGDRVVLSFNDIPSSGISWRLTDLPQDLTLVADSFDSDWEPGLLPSTRSTTSFEDHAGGTYPHSFLLEVSPDSVGSSGEISAVKDRAWSSDQSPTKEFRLQVKISPPLRGVQLDESALALAG